jgi:hypothetical protein
VVSKPHKPKFDMFPSVTASQIAKGTCLEAHACTKGKEGEEDKEMERDFAASRFLK